MVKEKATLAEDMLGGPDYIVLRHLDTDGIRIIGSVLGQSIALDYYVSQVILLSLLLTFSHINPLPVHTYQIRISYLWLYYALGRLFL